MKFVDRLRALLPGASKPAPSRAAASLRSLQAAMPGVGASDIIRMQASANQVIRGHLLRMRQQSRGLALNNDYVKGFLRQIETNVVGSDGVKLQNKARDFNGTLDKMANDIVEGAFTTWSKRENCDVRARESFRAMQKSCIRTVARDGEAFYRRIKNFSGSAHRYALQPIPAELVDVNYWDDATRTINGIEHDEWGRPTAYYLRQDGYFANNLVVGSNGHKYLRVPADEMIHIFINEFSDQVRGIPWIHTSMIRLHQLGAYEEAEVIAARIGASKMGFVVSPDGSASALADGEGADGYLTQEVTPGMVDVLPAGYDFRSFDPTHPSGNFGPFIKATLRGISTGLGINYTTLANDLEGVNYSSIRVGLVQEREHWKAIQTELQEQFLDVIFSDWIQYASLVGALSPLPASKLPKFEAPMWHFRGWAWVDPLKDIEASVSAINNGLKTRTQVLAELGQDFEETMQQLAEEQKTIDKYGVKLAPVDKSATQTQPQENTDPKAAQDATP